MTLFQELSYLSFQNQILTLQRASGFNISDLQVGKSCHQNLRQSMVPWLHLPKYLTVYLDNPDIRSADQLHTV